MFTDTRWDEGQVQQLIWTTLELSKRAKTVKDAEGAGQSNNLLYSCFNSNIAWNLHALRVGCANQV